MARRTRVLSALALAAAAALVPVQAIAQQPAHQRPTPPGTPCSAPVKPASQMTVEPCDSPDRIIEKAANNKPLSLPELRPSVIQPRSR